jgi:hypothetical protein
MLQHERLRRPGSSPASAEQVVAPPDHAVATWVVSALPDYSFARSSPVAPLRVGDAHDPMEREAHGVASALGGHGGRSAGPSVSRGGSTGAGRPLSPALTNAIEQERGAGRPLPSAVRRRFERVLGANLGAVRLHEGGRADELAGRLDAEAFTVGRDVFMRRDLTASAGGHGVLAHELSHVAQQDGRPAMVQRLPRPAWLKRLARRLGRRGSADAAETPYQPIPAFAPESPYQPIPGFPGGNRSHRFSGAYGVPIPARIDDEPEGGHYNTIPNFDDEPEGGHYNTIPNFDDEPEGGHYNTIPNFDDEPEGGHYNNIPDFSDVPVRPRRGSGPYGVALPATEEEMARRHARAKRRARQRVRFAE